MQSIPKKLNKKESMNDHVYFYYNTNFLFLQYKSCVLCF